MAIVQAQPNTIGGYIYTRSEYNAKGQLVKQYQDTGWNTDKTAATLYEYDSFGNISKQTLALTDSPTKDNSPVAEMAYSVESAEDGVFSVTSQTRYNAAGEPLSATQKQLISQLSTTLASKSVSIDVRGNSSVNWSEYTAPTKQTSFSTVPTSNITAESVSIDGFTILQKDHAGIISTATRSYTATGMTMVQMDGRNNATTVHSDLAGRTISMTDAANATTTTAYDTNHNQPAVVTDAMGNTSFYKYDARGRKIAEWGTALQPACFGYNDMDNMTTLRTFRADNEVITTDPSERSDYDQTTWVFNPVTGLEISKTYADNTSVVKTYDAYNRLATETDARGNVKTHSYEHARGLHLGTTYTVVDGTAETSARSFNYNHLGQLMQLTDDSGVRTFTYNTYGERDSDSLVVDGDTHLITETRDSFGRSIGYVYSKNGTAQQTVTTGYGTDGRINSAGFLHGGVIKQFGYEYLQGSNLLHKLTKPNGMTLTQTYEATRDFLTGMAYHRSSTLVAQRTYTYDILGRPTARNTARQGSVVNDTFTHNTRSELVEALVNGKDYEYTFDNIGNRQFSMEDNNAKVYDTNALNQYSAISENGAAALVPQFDADGNQTLIKTATAIWSAVYNAENRPVTFINSESNTVVECQYDSQGRRTYKKVTSNGSVTLHQRYIYRGYLQIACIDLTRSHHPALWFITWDPTQPAATRPLAIQKDGTWYTYGWDLTKNVCEVFGTSGNIVSSYTYAPYGFTTFSGSVLQPIQWSSEFRDVETDLIYYNHRHYNPIVGCWSGRDPYLLLDKNLYSFANNRVAHNYDYIGLIPGSEGAQAAANWGSNYAQGNVTHGLDRTSCKVYPERHKGVGIAFLNGNTAQNNLFKEVARKNGFWLFTPSSGKDFLKNLQTVTSEQCGNCIKTLTIAGHGHSRTSADSENGIPGKGNNTGFYNNISTMFGSAADISDLKDLINAGKVKFCNTCLIQIHSCRIGSVFASNFAQTTGCDVVFATGACSIEEDGRWKSGRSGTVESSNYLGEPYAGFKIAHPDGSIEDINRKPNIYQSFYTPI